MSKLSLKK